LAPSPAGGQSRCSKKRGLEGYTNCSEAQRIETWPFKKFDKSFRAYGGRIRSSFEQAVSKLKPFLQLDNEQR